MQHIVHTSRGWTGFRIYSALLIAVFSICLLTVIGFLFQTSANPPSLGGSSRPVMYASDHNWRQSPSSPSKLEVGENTIKLVPCPRGLMVSDPPDKKSLVTPHEYVLIAGTGKAEAAQITGGIGHGGDSSCTINVSTKEQHAGGYSVGSATGGVKEASEDAMFLVEPYGFGARRLQGGTVIIDSTGSPHDVYAPLYIEATNQIVRGEGGSINCYVADDNCMRTGDGNANHFWGIQLEHLRFRSEVSKGTTSALYVNSNGTTVRDVTALYSSTGGTFGHLVTVCDDQAFTLDGLNYVGIGLRGDKDFVGSVVYAPGPFNKCSAVGWLKNMQISAQCSGNGVDWQSGNSLHISDAVIQGFSQFGVRTGTFRGGYSPTQVDHVYMEVGSCANPIGNIGQAGLIAIGSYVVGKTDMLAIGQQPSFAKGGATHYVYWIIAKDSASGASAPLQAGYADSNGSNAIRVTWPAIKGKGTITYDVLRTTGAGNGVVAPFGSGNYAVATGIPQCSEPVCSAVERDEGPSKYSVNDNPTFFPNLMFWPGSLVLSGGAYADVEIPPVTDVSPIISTVTNVPTIFAERCPVGTPGVYAVCTAGDSFGNNQAQVVGTLLQNGPGSGGLTAGRKGRVNFMLSPLGSLGPTHVITLVDSVPAKTLADAMHRPSNDDSDTFIGLDVPPQGAPLKESQLAFGAPSSVSNYIGNKGDGSSWKERLTALAKTFAVPVVIKAGNTMTLGSGSPLAQMKIYKTNSVPSRQVPSQRCLDIAAPVSGLIMSDQVTAVTPAGPLGNLSLNAYPGGADKLTLHFCNPSPTSVDTPSGSYSFLAVH